MSARAADRLDAHVRRNDPMGLDARYLSAVAAPAYERAFSKIVADVQHAHLRFEPSEHEAMATVARVEAERGMVGGTDSDRL